MLAFFPWLSNVRTRISVFLLAFLFLSDCMLGGKGSANYICLQNPPTNFHLYFIDLLKNIYLFISLCQVLFGAGGI